MCAFNMLDRFDVMAVNCMSVKSKFLKLLTVCDLTVSPDD